MERQSFCLGTAVGLLVLLVLLFPTRAGVERWVSSQREQARQGMG